MLVKQLNIISFWRGGRVVEGAALEMLFRGNFNEGSNPSLSVLIFVINTEDYLQKTIFWSISV